MGDYCRLIQYSKAMSPRLARILELCVGGFDEPWSTPVHRAIDVDSLFYSLEAEKRQHAILLLGSIVAGFAYYSIHGREASISVCVDPFLPPFYSETALRELLYAARTFLEEERVFSAKIVAGFEQGYLHQALNKIVGFEGDEHIATLMIYTGRSRKVKMRGDYAIRPACIYRDIDGIVEVYNKAFSEYTWFKPLTREEALELYASKANTVIYVAVARREKRIVGFIYAEHFRALDGKKTLFLSALAVDPEHQRRGLGTALLRQAVVSVPRGTRIALSSYRGLEKLYSRMGFQEKRRWIAKNIPLHMLPSKSSCRYKP